MPTCLYELVRLTEPTGRPEHLKNFSRMSLGRAKRVRYLSQAKINTNGTKPAATMMMTRAPLPALLPEAGACVSVELVNGRFRSTHLHTPLSLRHRGKGKIVRLDGECKAKSSR